MARRRKSLDKGKIFEIYFYVLSVFFVISIGMIYYMLQHPLMKVEKVYSYTYKPASQNQGHDQRHEVSSSIIGPRYSYIKIPAVMNNSIPVYVIGKMVVLPGRGNIFIDIKDTLIGEDTQQSIRKAILYALKHEHLDPEKFDFYVNIEGDATTLTGPSAGAAFAILAIAALRNETPNPSVMITGTLTMDGKIGLSGKILEKALAAKRSGADIFLVPKGLSIIQEAIPKMECDYYGGKKYCDVVEMYHQINVSKKAHIKVQEVESIDDALPYFGL